MTREPDGPGGGMGLGRWDRGSVCLQTPWWLVLEWVLFTASASREKFPDFFILYFHFIFLSDFLLAMICFLGLGPSPSPKSRASRPGSPQDRLNICVIALYSYAWGPRVTV